MSLTAGQSYTITETTANLPAGWSLTGATCSGTTAAPVNGGVKFTPAGGQSITCEFTNTLAKPALIIKKTVVNGDGQTQFSFTGGNGLSISPLTPGSGNASAQTGTMSLTAGQSYTITETTANLPAGWSLTGATCSGTTATPVNGGVKFTPAGGQNITCEFTNTLAKPALIIKKTVVNGDGQTQFSFTGSNGLSISPLTPGSGNASAQTGTMSLTSGTDYTITENTGNLPAGWTLTGAVCSGVNATPVNGGVKFNAGGGQNITCEFTNQLQQQGTLKVVKAAIGGDDNFTFTANGSTFTMRNGGQQSFSLPAGTYQVSENSLPNGWKLQGATCTQGGALTGNTIQATVTGNTTTTCTFTNFLQKDNKMGDVTKLYLHERVDNLISNQPDRARILRRLEGAPAPGLKDGGSYSEPTENASGAPGSLKDPVRSDLARLQGRTENMGSSTIGDVKVSASLAQAQADAAAAERRKLSEAGLSASAAPYNYAVLNPAFDVWMEAHYSSYADGLGGINREGQFGVLFAGADYVVRPGFLIGALVQIDRTVEDIEKSRPHGPGKR